MTFSFTLILGLFLLAPGLAVFAGLYHGSRLGPVESPPPPPGSILALSIVLMRRVVSAFAGKAGLYPRVTKAGVARREAMRASPIEQLYLDRARIKNVAFERLRFVEEG